VARARSAGRVRRRAVAAALALLVAGLAAGAGPASAETDKQLRQRQSQLRQQAAEAEEQLDAISDAAVAASAALADVQAQQPQAQAALDAATAQVQVARARDVELAGRLAAAQAAEAAAVASMASGDVAIQDTSKALSRIASQAYRTGGMSTALALAMDADSPEAFTDRYVMVDAALRVQSGAMARLREQRALHAHEQEKLEAVRAEVARLKAEAEAQVAQTQAAEAAAAERKADLDSLAVQRTQALATLETEKAAHQQEAAAAQAASDDIAAELRAREAAAAARRAASGKPRPPSGGPPAATGGVLGAPLAKLTVTSDYGYRVHPVYGTRRLHAGTDFRAACGTPVYAAEAGEVIRAGVGSGYGNIVVVDHDEVAGRSVATAYAHLSRFAVGVGTSVSRGQLIAWSGSTGVGTACHLHFEVRVSGGTVDPRGWL